ncbi:RHS repeat-associated protein [Catenuloplanes atrovinosus]|uniref:RHS repeat-associated protein n=1 Tax=Catenuloplanes atrovinosus TaxID=137266 RepID=A0AAE3YJH5_9ACTN|nr:ricin-type beta-trefoil lectin domain protein [Catenuloplanes atrovinosus]MDR7273632.1 RHS repeat-associated protein [Catenuloplanes atrovinosus]
MVSGTGTQGLAVPPSGADRNQQVDLPPLPETRPVTQDESADQTLEPAPEVPVDPYAPTAVAPWSEGTGTVDLTGAEPGELVKVADLPVSLGVPEGADPATVDGEWTVDLAAPEASQDAGVPGLIMKLSPPATAEPEASVALSVDYTTFADLYGPQAADRFGLMLLPDCVYDALGTGDCAPSDEEETAPAASSQLLSSEVEVVPAAAGAGARAASATGERRVVTGTVPVSALRDAAPAAANARAAAAADAGGVVGALDTGASVSGDFTATPLLSSGSWAAGSSSGAFTYSYQVTVPQTGGGMAPQINLGYSSQSVDGRTSSTNNQASWIGDGWDYSAGQITRTYAGCRQDSKKAGSNNAKHKTGDMCWGSQNATLSLGGTTTELVYANGTWTTANGDGSRIERKLDTTRGNGDRDGEYWIVTTRDGTRYHFGLNKLPGWTDGKPVTNSVLTMPVYGNHAGEPCYNSDWTKSYCTQAWRWSLDYVEDLQGNAMSFWWTKEDKGYYARNFNWKAPVSYDRAGYLSRIDYGQRADSIFTATAPASVAFSVAERCYAEGSLTCSAENFKSKDPGKYRIWYDTPADLRCEAKKMCWNAAPTFWSTKRLDKITTSALRVPGSGTRQVVDEYQLDQTFPVLKTGPNTALWLKSITRTGYGLNTAANERITLNAVKFESNTEDMPNRVKKDNRPGFSRLRIGRVINEYGGETVVNYRKPVGDCSTGTGLPGKGDTAALKNNDRLCYPAYWHPDPEAEEIDWFHKYVVESVEELPNVDGAANTVTRYEYDRAGWKLAEQEFTKKATRTYSQFAGFEKVTVLTGSEVPEFAGRTTKSVTRFFRGMGDTVSVKDAAGVEIAKDEEPFAGRIAEELTYASHTDADDRWLTRSVTVPAAQELARRARDDGLSPLIAWRVTEPRAYSVTRSSGTGDDKRTLRTLETKTTFETTYGLPTRVEFLGDTGVTGDESCQQLEYLHRADKNLIGLSKEVRTLPAACGAAPDFTDLKKLSSAVRTAYDGAAFGAALAANTRGLATETWSLKADGSGFQSDGTTGFDAVGRVTSRTDVDGKASTVTYEPALGQAFKVIEKNSLGHTQTQELEPGRAVTVRTTDANDRVSVAEYDALGRLRKAWAPGRTPNATTVPDFEAVYNTQPKQVPNVITYTRGHDNKLQTAVTFFDGLGRERQSQEEAVGGGRLITDTLYNGSGEVWQTNNAYYSTKAPEPTLFSPESDTLVPNATRYTYDGLGRVLTETPLFHGTPATDRITRYEYGPDYSTVINPAGAASYRVFSDANGRTTRVDTFTDGNRVAFTSLRYEYDARGQMAKAVHGSNAAKQWSWVYDGRGRVISATDPDAGTTTTTYDHRDRTLTTTNARGVTLWNGYDELSRPTQQRLNGPSGTQVSSFTYDTAPGGKGLPATATRYTDGLAYTQSVGGYTYDYQPTSTTLTLPQSIATEWGFQNSYTYGYTYTDTGLPETMQLPSVGNFPSERLLVRYTKDGLPLTVSGKDWYGSETAYSPYGQVLRSTLGTHPYRVWSQSTFDEASGALTTQQVYRENAGNTALVTGHLVSNRNYTYDAAGNVLAIRERADGIAERQCFIYDAIGQLTKAWTAKNQEACNAGPANADGTTNVAAGKDNSGYWQEYGYDDLGNRQWVANKDINGDKTKDVATEYDYGRANGSQPGTLTKVRKKFTTPEGAAVTAEAERLYELTGETKAVTSLTTGDKQELTWTYDGQVERVTGQGENGKTAYYGLGDKCLDLKSGLAQPGTVVQLYTCNATIAQKWTFTAVPNQADPNLGTLAAYDSWCLQPAANTAGSALAIQKCDGSAAQRLKRNSSGQYTHVASGLCVAVKDAANLSGTAVVLATCDASSAAQKWEAQNQTRYIYGPSGTPLLSIQGKQATLDLGDAQVTTNKGGVLVKTHRSYGTPGGTILRYAYGTAAPNMVAIAADPQGSPAAEIALQNGMETRIRKQDPFGNVRGTSVNLQTDTGFLGAGRDDASGYTRLGARLYDPSVGRFLSADPVVDLQDPMQSNGYSYAHNNPVTHTDPTGLSISLTPSEMAAALAGAGLTTAQVAQAQATMNQSLMSVIMSAAWGILAEFIGINDAIGCFGGDMWACGSLILGAIPWGKVAKIPSVAKAINRTINAIQAWQSARKAAQTVLAAAKAAERQAIAAKKAAIERAKKAAEAARKKAAEKANTTSNRAVNEAKKTGNTVQKDAQAKAAPRSSSASATRGGGGKPQSAKPSGNAGGGTRAKGGSSGGGGAGKADSGGGSCKLNNSFVPGTRVHMADGSTKAIEDVAPGDKVKATDPETGETTVQTVTATIEGEGVKRLVKVVIDTDGATAELTATDGHPFWVPELGRWVEATELRPGQWLRTGAGSWVQVSSVERWTVTHAVVHNLSVSGVHTYYVVAGGQPVLVHNCGPTETDASLARDRAEELQSGRDDYWNAANHGTTAVIGVFNTKTKQWTNHIAINGDGEMPSGWTLGANEKFVQGRGHAEEAILNNLGPDEVVGFGGTSRNICRDICYPLLNGAGMRFGGAGYFGGRADKTEFSLFWQEDW